VSLEQSENEDFEYIIKLFHHVYDRNGNTKRPVTPFFVTWVGEDNEIEFL
jgi:hypothetical protein